ncbi:MAG: ferrous iron transporter B [Clostridia bacterium]|nr:ferrous iron transporter B [Clostridia bacterium]
MRYLIFGNPNSGKTTLYNALTSSHEKTGNWHGVTVDKAEKEVKGDVFCDVPGLYSLNVTSPEELASVQTLSKDCVVLNVIEASLLKRGLALTKELSREGYPVIVIVTMTEELKKRGGFLDEKGLSALLGTPVLLSEGKSGRELLALIKGTKPKVPHVAEIPASVFRPGAYRESKFEALCFQPAFSFALFLSFVALAFFLTFSEYGVGAFLKGLVEYAFASLSSLLSQSISLLPLRSFVCDGLLLGVGSVLSFLPQILLLQLFLLLMEESGFLSVFAFAGDGFFRKIGLSGRAVFSLLMGFGCTATAIQTCRAHEKEMQNRLFSLFPYLSCSAKMPVYVTLFSSLFPRPFLPVLLLTFSGGALALFFSARKQSCDCLSAVSEVAPLRIPDPNNLLKSLCFSAKSFIMKVAGVILAFLLVSWFFSSYNFQMQFVAREQSMLASVCKVLRFLFYPMGITDWEMAYAFLGGVVAKENVAGLLELFYPNGTGLPLPSLLAFAVCMLTTAPCVSAVASLSAMVGKRRAVAWFFRQLLFGFLFGYATYALCLYPILLCLPLMGVLIEGIYRKRKTIFERIHGSFLSAGFALFKSSAQGKGRQGQRRARRQKRHAGEGG